MAQKRSSTIGPIMGFTAISVALYTILFSGVRGFSAEDAEYRMARLASHLSEEANKRGRDAKLQYSGIEMQGFAYDKWALISTLSLDLMYQQWQGGTHLGLSTESAALTPDHTDPARLLLHLDKNINIISGSELLAIVQPARPASYWVKLEPGKDNDTVRHHLSIPGNLGVIMLDPKREWSLRLADPIASDLVLYEAERRITSQVISGAIEAMAHKGTWSIDSSDIRYDSVLRTPQDLESRGSFAINGLSFSRGNRATTPFTTTAAWRLKQHRNISGGIDNSELSVERSLLTVGEAQISATGTLNFDLDDSMYGEIILEIYEPLQLIRSGWFAPEEQTRALELLSKIAGDDVASYTHISVAIEREKNGNWRVGKVPLGQIMNDRFMELFTFDQQDENNDSSQEETDPS